MKELTLKITGISPILLSADKLADPLDPATIAHKALTSKRKKTEEDHLAIARSQWEGLLYWDDKLNVVLPTQNIRATMLNGAKMNKLGTQIKRGTIMLEDKVELNYGAKLTKDQLWEGRYIDRRSVVVSNARVMAYRPRFIDWSAKFTIAYDESILDESDIVRSMQNAGSFVGIGGFRPEKSGTFGRFEVAIV